MRSILVAFCIALLLTAAAPLAFGQMMPGGGGGGPMMQEQNAKELTPEQFSEMKARILKRLEERRTRMEQEKKCIDASTNAEELRKCRPEPPMGPLGPGGQRRGGQQGRQPMGSPMMDQPQK